MLAVLFKSDNFHAALPAVARPALCLDPCSWPAQPAVAELEALKAKLEALQQQLAKEKASSSAGLLAPLPDYWDPMDPEEEGEVKFVELPLPGAPWMV